jgi:hypothetical protein
MASSTDAALAAPVRSAAAGAALPGSGRARFDHLERGFIELASANGASLASSAVRSFPKESSGETIGLKRAALRVAG